MNSLTPGAIQMIVEDESKTTDKSFCPILQIMNVKRLASAPGAADRFRVILSDGQWYMQGMLASQLTQTIHDGKLQQDCLIRLKSYMRNQVQGTIICIALELDIVEPPCGKIGNPSAYVPGSAPQVRPAAPQQAAPLYNTTNAATAEGSPPAYKKARGPYGTSNMTSPVRSNPYQQQQQHHHASAHAAPIVRSQAVASPFTAIKELNLYQNRWTIQARVVSKSDVRTWSNAKGEGRLFSVELLDESCDIRATFFKEAVDRFYDMLQQGQVYTFSGGKLKVANVQYNTCKSNYEITFDQNAEIHLDQTGAANNIAAVVYNFTSLADIESVEEKANVDVLGVITSVGEVATLLSRKSGREVTKCDITIVDQSAAQITLTLWGQEATKAPETMQAGASIIAARRARVSDYNGKSLSGGQQHTVIPFDQVPTTSDPTLRQQVQALLQWWQTTGSSAPTKVLSTTRAAGGARPPLADRKPVQSIRDDHLGQSGQQDWISFKAEVSFIKKDKDGGAWYTACPNAGEPCKNRYKVTEMNEGQYYCEKCAQTYPNTVRRWIFSALLEDASGSTWVNFFNEQAEALLGGVTADEVHAATLGDQQAYDTYFTHANHSEWVFRCKVKQEMVNDEMRTKTSVVSLFPIDYAQDAKEMLAALEI